MISTLSSSGVILTQGFQQPALLNVDAVNHINGKEYDVDVYPNPTEGLVNVTIKAIKNKNISLQIIDVLGRNIKTNAITQINGDYQALLDFTPFAGGIYFLSVFSEGQVIVTAKITKSE